LRRWVICVDGTWNTSLRNIRAPYPSNVERLTHFVAKTSAGVEQIVVYFDGVGTEGTWLEAAYAGATGRGFSTTVKRVYRFLAQNFADGDELFLFGFSRGAFTVRCVLDMIRRVGLLDVSNITKLAECYDAYRREFAPTNEARAGYGRNVKITCVGLWDTVGALAPDAVAPESDVWSRHYYGLTVWVKNAFHALAIHEQRRDFAPMLWFPRGDSSQHVEQTWFVGVHADVGGGYDDHRLADIPLLWMIQNAETCGLVFDRSAVERAIEPSVHGRLHDSMTWWYRARGAVPRRVCDESPLWRTFQSLHPTVHEFADVYPQYCPPNLVAALARARDESTAPGATLSHRGLTSR
jgi:uncharacterized protein (DUF2235 family)